MKYIIAIICLVLYVQGADIAPVIQLTDDTKVLYSPNSGRSVYFYYDPYEQNITFYFEYASLPKDTLYVGINNPPTSSSFLKCIQIEQKFFKFNYKHETPSERIYLWMILNSYSNSSFSLEARPVHAKRDAKMLCIEVIVPLGCVTLLVWIIAILCLCKKHEWRTRCCLFAVLATIQTTFVGLLICAEPFIRSSQFFTDCILVIVITGVVMLVFLLGALESLCFAKREIVFHYGFDENETKTEIRYQY